MKRILKLLARMYPAEWRARYGAEYDALLEEGSPRLRDAADVFWGAFTMQMTSWRPVRTVLVCMLLGTIAAVALSFTRPILYRSQTLITVDTSDRRPLDRQLASLVGSWWPDPTVISIIQRENLYPRERTRMPMSDVVDLMRKNVYIRPLSKADGKPASAFVVQFYYPDPQIAQRVDRELVSACTRANLLAAETGSRRGWTFAVVDAPDLPQRPFFPNRPEFGAVGLLTGLIGGLILAAVAGFRRGSTVVTG